MGVAIVNIGTILCGDLAGPFAQGDTVTTAISASEVHVPGRPRDADGVKALAVAAHKCFAHYRPGGMKVHAGSVILEPTLNGNDLGEIAKQGVWLAKAGFGAFKTAFEYSPPVAAARAHGRVPT